MHKEIKLAILLSVAALTMGCATPYMIDRARDAADVFTASGSMGAGVKAQVGPVHAGVIFSVGHAGFRGGEWTSIPAGGEPRNGDVEFLIMPWPDDGLTFGLSKYEPSDGSTGVLRGKGYSAESAIPFVTTRFQEEGKPAPVSRLFDHCLSQLEVSGGLFFVGHLGFNLGELLDFILGWTTIDILGDDLDAEKQSRPKAPGATTP